jgi:NHLM bacteriocin system ABC transporter peptidase/ATP-binding protein
MAEQTSTPPRLRRVRTPTVLQMEAVECGAAALGIVLGYHGKFVTLEELRVACGVSRDGTKASNILKAARGYGLKAKGFSKKPGELPELPLPLVVFWNFNHFVAVEGFGPDRVYLNDPGVGPRTVTQAEFDASFTGVVLVFEPGADFKAGGSRPSLLAPLARRLRGSEAGLLYVILASLALALTGLLIPAFAQVFVDYGLQPRFSSWVGPLLIGMALTAGLRAGLTWLQRHFLLRLETRLSLTSSYRFFRHVLCLPIEFFTQRYGGEVGSRVEINDAIARLLSRDLATNVLNVVMAGCYLALMLYFDIVLTLLTLLIAALNFLALRAVARYRKDVNVRLLQERAKLMGTNMSGLVAIETLKATGAEADFFSRWSGQLAKVMTTQQRMGVSTLVLGSVPVFLEAVDSAAILGVGAVRVIDQHMTVGMLVAFQSLMISFLVPVNQLVQLGSTLQEVEGEMNRLDDVMRYPADPRTNGEARGQKSKEPETPRLSGRLELCDITYGYSRLDPPLIQGFNLSMTPGMRIALVGASGSGKSTLAKIISGLYRPWSGQVLLDGRPSDEVPRAVFANSVAVVDQDFFLFEGTVREVLTMWDGTVPEEDMVRAAKDACIHEDIAGRAGGYDSKVEEGGGNFSGGQRQRLEIARALVNNPALLVLDEATSALDAVTEERIDENLRRRGCTCVIVAHRLSTIRDCDEIIVLEQGRVVQRGTHEELYRSRGPYRRLIES